MIEKTLSTSGIRVGVSCDHSTIIEQLDEMFDMSEENDCMGALRVERCAEDTLRRALIPENALRTHINESRGTEHFVHDGVSYLFEPGFLLVLDKRLLESHLYYDDVSSLSSWHLVQMLRWLVKGVFHERKCAYIPGHVFTGSDSTVIISGHPECGRSTLARYMAERNASLSGKNPFIDLKDRSLISSAVGFPGREDHYHELKKHYPHTELHTESMTPARMPIPIIFANEWQEADSVLQSLSDEDGIASLDELNRREYEYCDEEQRHAIRELYRGVVPDTRFYRLLIGNDARKAAAAVASVLCASGRKRVAT